MFITLLQAAIARSTVVFKKLAEDQVGEFDLVVAPASDAVRTAPHTPPVPPALTTHRSAALVCRVGRRAVAQWQRAAGRARRRARRGQQRCAAQLHRN